MTPPLNREKVPLPQYRRLRAFAFDPIFSRRIDTHEINEVIIELPWEDVLLGPVGDYLEVVDYDPASQVFYSPLDLNDIYLLAQDGLPASEGNPQFHQQMVYAVARNTINHFEEALGRRTLWLPRRVIEEGIEVEKFIKRLRIYPHALREANAYYSPVKMALLFGYFPASLSHPGENLPGGTVFTCLSHDIIAHETTHALLDGLNPLLRTSTNVDVLALHEAFADIVALYQHFTHPEVLRHQIARTRGNLERQNLLGELAFQFGQAIGYSRALRSAIGRIDPETKNWISVEPDPNEIHRTTKPHQRGAIFVAAVFEAFLTIYKDRSADLWSIATDGTSEHPPGERTRALRPALLGRLAQEAATTARDFLHMFIRALDYCPPVDVDFGDYLRALITADHDLATYDHYKYRLAIIEAFRRRSIYPREVRFLSEESLLWKPPTEMEQRAFRKIFTSPSKLRELGPDITRMTDRERIFEEAQRSRRVLHKWFKDPRAKEAVEAAHIVLDKDAPEAFYRDDKGVPLLGIEYTQTTGTHIVKLDQARRGYFNWWLQDEMDSGRHSEPEEPDFIFRGGCTLLIDADTAMVRYCIHKRIRSKNRLNRMREFLVEDTGPSLRATYSANSQQMEPFALLNRSLESEEEM